MGFLATPKARSARSLVSASTPASRHRISTRSGCSCGSCESSWNWNAVAGRRSSLSKRSSPDPGGARRETVYSTLRGGELAGLSAYRLGRHPGARISARERKRRTRRLILIGSYMEHVTQTDPDRKDRLMKGLDGFLERDRDRELFDLPPKEVSK